MRNLALVILASALTGSTSRAADYFPLQKGNQWIYRCVAGCPTESAVTVEILDTAQPNPAGPVYYVLQGFGTNAWIRMTEDGNLVALDRQSGSERLWYAFGAPEGEEYSTSVHPCNTSAGVSGRNIDYQGPLGEFHDALGIDYPGATCDLQGLVQEIFLPGIGLARRIDQVPGSRRYELVYARVGNAVVSASGISFGLSLDRPVYHYNPALARPTPEILPMFVRITLRNDTDEPVSFVSSNPLYDLIIRNEKGEAVYQWSEGRAFAAVIVMFELSRGEKNYSLDLTLVDRQGRPLPSGKYSIEAWLNNMGAKAYSATVRFEIRES